MADDRTVEILIKFGLDEKGAKDAAKAIAAVRSESGKSSKEISGASNALKDMVAQGARLLTIGAIMTSIGRAVNNYVQQSGVSEQTSRRWLEASQKLDNAWVNFGRTLTQMILPAYEAIADAMDRISKGIFPDVQAQLDAQANLTPAQKKLSHEEQMRIVQANARGGGGGTYLDQGGYSDVGVQSRGRVPATGTAGLGGGTGGGSDFLPLEQLIQMRSFMRQEQQARISYERSQYTMNRDFEKQEEYAVADYNRMRMRSNRDFEIQRAFQEKEYYRERAIAARDFGIQMVRNEQDFQRTRSRAQQDHEFDLAMIAMSGDAMQYWLAERSFKIQQQRAEEDYNINKQRAEEDFRRQQSDADTSFQIQRAQAMREREIMLADQEEDFQIQRERAKYQHNLALSDMQWSFNLQRDLRRQAFMDQYTTAQTQEQAMAALRRQFLQYQYDEFVAMMEAGYQAVDLIKNYYGGGYGGGGTNGGAPSPGTGHSEKVPALASGGYTRQGLAYLHNNEFVMDEKATAAAEAAARGNLTNQALIQMFGQMGGAGLTYNDHRRFDTSVSAEDRREITDDTLQLLSALLP